MTMPAVLGIDIGGTKISLCVAAMSGKVVASRRIETRSGDGAPVVLDRLTSAARDLVRQVLGEHRADVRGVGVVTPGVVEAHAVRLAPNNQGWEAVALTATVPSGSASLRSRLTTTPRPPRPRRRAGAPWPG